MKILTYVTTWKSKLSSGLASKYDKSKKYNSTEKKMKKVNFKWM